MQIPFLLSSPLWTCEGNLHHTQFYWAAVSLAEGVSWGTRKRRCCRWRWVFCWFCDTWWNRPHCKKSAPGRPEFSWRETVGHRRKSQCAHHFRVQTQLKQWRKSLVWNSQKKYFFHALTFPRLQHILHANCGILDFRESRQALLHNSFFVPKWSTGTRIMLRGCVIALKKRRWQFIMTQLMQVNTSSLTGPFAQENKCKKDIHSHFWHISNQYAHFQVEQL